MFRFDEIQAVRFGRDVRGAEAVPLAILRLTDKISANHRRIVEQAEASAAASLCLVLNDESVYTLNGIRLHCGPEDFAQFIGLLQSGQHRLFR